MITIRKIIALLCAFIILLSLAACKTQSESQEPVSEKNETRALDTIPAEMPVVRINTGLRKFDFATKPTREDKLRGEIEYVDAAVSVDNCEEQYVISDADARVKVRGNYTLEYPKKSIRIKFEKKQSMLGLASEQKYKNWVLLAEWKDLSMCNTPTAFYIADKLLGKDGYYSTDYQFVELYINDVYWGVYLLCEQQEVKDERTSVPEVEDDYSGTDIGYFFEYDGYYLDERIIPDGDPTFEIDYGNYAVGKNGSIILEGYKADGMHGYTVKSDINSDSQLEFISSYTENVYKILYSAVCEDKYYTFNEDLTALVSAEGKSAQEVVSEVIDVQSLADIYLLHEIAINPDLGWSSFYMSVDMSEEGSHKLVFEAPWDFDSCFGIRAGWENPNGMYIENAWSPNPWLSILHDEEWFMDMVRERWAELKEDGVPETAIERIKTYKKTYAENFERNYERWDERITEGNHELVPELNEYRTQGEAADYLINWLENRFEYLDRELS